MKSLIRLASVVACGMSMSVFAAGPVNYECGKLKDRYGNSTKPFTSYSLKVDDEFVILQTAHGSDKGLHSTTNALMRPVGTHGKSQVFEALGLTVRFVKVPVGDRIVQSVILSDSQGQSARCIRH